MRTDAQEREREELIATLDDIEAGLTAPHPDLAPRTACAWELEYLAASLDSYLAAYDEEDRVRALHETWPRRTEDRPSSGRRASVDELRRLAAAAESAKDPRSLGKLLDRARAAVEAAFRG